MSTCFYRIRYRNSVCKIAINKYKCRVISVFIVNNLVISNTYKGFFIIPKRNCQRLKT